MASVPSRTHSRKPLTVLFSLKVSERLASCSECRVSFQPAASNSTIVPTEALSESPAQLPVLFKLFLTYGRVRAQPGHVWVSFIVEHEGDAISAGELQLKVDVETIV